MIKPNYGMSILRIAIMSRFHNIFSITKRLLLTFVIMTVFFTTISIIAFSIPESWIFPNIEKSARIIYNEGLYPNITSYSFLRRDNYSDSWMIGISLSDTTESLLRRTMLNPSFRSVTDPDTPLNGMYEAVLHSYENLEKITYGRYWHGYQIILRIMLSSNDILHIRIVNWIIFFFLIGWTGVLLYRRISLPIAILFLFWVLLSTIPVVPSCMHFFTCYAISLIASCSVLQFNCIRASMSHSILFFFIIGGITSFFDLLSTPVLTLGLPLIVLLLTSNYRHSIYTILILSIIWSIGYLSIWSIKWIIATLLTGEDIISDALNTIFIRTGTDIGSFTPSYFITRFNYKIVNFVCLVTAVMFFIYIKNPLRVKLNIEEKNVMLLLIIIALIVPSWYILTPNHTFIHWWFTWRALTVSMLALSIAYTTSIFPKVLGK